MLEFDLAFWIANRLRFLSEEFFFGQWKWCVNFQFEIRHDDDIIPKLLIRLLFEVGIELFDDFDCCVSALCAFFTIFNACDMIHQTLNIFAVFFQNKLLFVKYKVLFAASIFALFKVIKKNYQKAGIGGLVYDSELCKAK